VLLALATLAPLGAARAQVSNPLKFTIFGGAALPVGDTQDFYKTGYTVGGALDLRVPLSPLGFRGELAYSGLDGKGLLDGDNITDLGANLNAVLWLPTATPLRPYITGGPSYSRLKYEQGGVSGSQSDNEWGFNIGGGLQFGLGDLGTRLDIRYRRLSSEGEAFSIIPITFGVTF
jgi:opacity protein-like surface antigen